MLKVVERDLRAGDELRRVVRRLEAPRGAEMRRDPPRSPLARRRAMPATAQASPSRPPTYHARNRCASVARVSLPHHVRGHPTVIWVRRGDVIWAASSHGHLGEKRRGASSLPPTRCCRVCSVVTMLHSTASVDRERPAAPPRPPACATASRLHRHANSRSSTSPSLLCAIASRLHRQQRKSRRFHLAPSRPRTASARRPQRAHPQAAHCLAAAGARG